MPTTNFIEVPLSEVPGHLEYDGDKDHERHQYHEVEPVKLVGRDDEQSFLQDIRRTMRHVHPFQRELDSVKAGLGWVISFAPGSFPSDDFIHRIEATLVKIVGCRQYARSLHRGLNGQADLHLFHPTHDLDVPIVPFRNRQVNLLGRVRAALDKLTREENSKLPAEGKAPMLTPADVQRERRRTSGEPDIAEIIAKVRAEPSEPWVKGLQDALESHGITRWEIDLQSRLVIHLSPGARKKKKRPLMFDITPQLIGDLQRQPHQTLPEIRRKDRAKRNTPDRNTTLD
jgi:hypothetical protein